MVRLPVIFIFIFNSHWNFWIFSNELVLFWEFRKKNFFLVVEMDTFFSLISESHLKVSSLPISGSPYSMTGTFWTRTFN